MSTKLYSDIKAVYSLKDKYYFLVADLAKVQ